MFSSVCDRLNEKTIAIAITFASFSYDRNRHRSFNDRAVHCKNTNVTFLYYHRRLQPRPHSFVFIYGFINYPPYVV